jgi:hypothetical protein
MVGCAQADLSSDMWTLFVMVWVCCYDTPSDVLWAVDGFMGMVRRAGMDFRSFDFFSRRIHFFFHLTDAALRLGSAR